MSWELRKLLLKGKNILIWTAHGAECAASYDLFQSSSILGKPGTGKGGYRVGNSVSLSTLKPPKPVFWLKNGGGPPAVVLQGLRGTPSRFTVSLYFTLFIAGVPQDLRKSTSSLYGLGSVPLGSTSFLSCVVAFWCVDVDHM